MAVPVRTWVHLMWDTGCVWVPAASQLSFIVDWFFFPLWAAAAFLLRQGCSTLAHQWKFTPGSWVSSSRKENCPFCTTEWQLQGYFSALLLRNSPVSPLSSVVLFLLRWLNLPTSSTALPGTAWRTANDFHARLRFPCTQAGQGVSFTFPVVIFRKSELRSCLVRAAIRARSQAR